MDQRFTETDRKNRKDQQTETNQKYAETNKKIKETGQQIENILRF